MEAVVTAQARVWVTVIGGSMLAGVALLVYGPQLWPRLGLHHRVPPLRSASDPWRGYLAPDSTCPGEDDVAAPVDAQSRTMVCLLDWARARRGLPELPLSPTLDRSALLKARDIVRCRDFSHTACGKSDLAPFEAVGYTQAAWKVGENLAWGGGPLGAPARALDGWLNSPPHREALFEGDWTEQGVAVLPIANFRGEPTGEIWVSHFGRR
jgi:uncharacterized protein YkwD